MGNESILAPKSMFSGMGNSTTKSNKERFFNLMSKKPSIASEDKCEILVSSVEEHLDDELVGYVNLSRFLYLVANLEYLKGSFRRKKALKRANVHTNKMRGFDNKVAKRLDVFSCMDSKEYDCRYAEVMDGLSQLAIANLTGYKEINAVKNTFTKLLTKNRSTAFFNIETSSRVLPNKYPIFNAFLYCTVLNGALPMSEMGKLATICEYVNPYHSLFKTSMVYSTLYVKEDSSLLHTELNAVCDLMTDEYYTLVEASKFKLLLKFLLEFNCTKERYTGFFVDYISDMCALYFSTRDDSTGKALNSLRSLINVRFLGVTR